MRRILACAGLLAVGAYVAMSVGVSSAQNPNQAAPANAQGTGFSDQLFAMAAAASDMAEVGAGQMATRQAGSDEVKRLAQRLVEDHTQSSRQLTDLAGRKRIALPRDMDVQDRAAAGILMELRGEEFDREFLKKQLAVHLCAVQLFTAESERGRDADLKAMASKLLPTLKEHLQMVRQIMKEDAERK